MEESKKVTRSIAEEKIGLIREQLVSKSFILGKFMKASLGVLRLEKEIEKVKNEQTQLYEGLQENKKAFETILTEIANEMGLDKEYNWHFDGEGAFIGVPQIQMPQPTIAEVPLKQTKVEESK